MNKDDLEYRDTADGAVAILIHQYNSKGHEGKESGVVMFGDDSGTTVQTGQKIGNEDTVLLYPMPKAGVFVNNAEVKYIRKKEKEEE